MTSSSSHLKFSRLFAGALIAVAFVAWSSDLVDTKGESAGTNPDRSPPAVIDLAGVLHLIKGDRAILVDARNLHAFQAGHMPGALHCEPNDEAAIARLKASLGEVGNKQIVVYCSSSGCLQSTFLARKLNRSGVSRVAIYLKGIEEWKLAGQPIEKPTKKI